jgi:hypothetical protein
MEINGDANIRVFGPDKMTQQRALHSVTQALNRYPLMQPEQALRLFTG